MSELERIPVVKRESAVSKNVKMVCVVMAILLFLYSISPCAKAEIYVPKIHHNIKYMRLKRFNRLNPALGKYIQVIHFNDKPLPLKKIVVIDKNRNIFPLFAEDAKYLPIDEKKSMIHFNLPKVVYISQIVLDIDELDARRGNVPYASIVIRDTKYDKTWFNVMPLKISTHIDVEVIESPKVRFADQQKIDPILSTPEQEAQLTHNLVNNVW